MMLFIVAVLLTMAFLSKSNESSYIKKAVLFLVTATVLIKVLAFSHEDVIRINSNPVINLIREVTKVVFD
ncbi:MAG: hypothetical protein F6K40_08920 [Okeania sp. SIO3I5]|uniref:hypothetical protein n=1 Tax=Okeania sp. SIO3I5 TaxID=2607805 RepID=UPI0013BB0A0A|nr:hypothetical protein [Okeania sp. SIO3I5]NEQ36387.1 hypothetical protein [Okeania sp. SIO3I5]